MKNFKLNTILLALILISGFIIRLWRVDEPLADWHSWRQVDTAGVTREYLKHGIDLLHPRYMDISSIPSGKENPQGWRMVEFPFINGLVAEEIGILGNLGIFGSLVQIERLTSIIFSLGSMWFLYLIVRRLIDERTALLAMGVFAFLPYNIYYSRAVLPEPKLVFFSMLTTWGFVEFINKGSWKFWAIGVIGGIGAILLKPIWIIVYGPALFYLAVIKYKLNVKKWVWLLVGGILIILPFWGWREWIKQFPEGTPAANWLFNGDGIRLRPAWFRWLFMDRLGRLMLGYWGLILLGLGAISKPGKKEGMFFYWWILGSWGYLIILATGNVRHDYYQAILVPVTAVFVAKGMSFLLKVQKEYFSKFSSYGLLIMSTTFMLAFGWYQVKDYFNINHPEIVEAGKIADRILPKNVLVIAPYGGDTAFLFQTNRKGWPIGGSIDEKIKLGASYYISTNFDDETSGLMKKCLVIEKTEKYVIVNLQQCSNLTI